MEKWKCTVCDWIYDPAQGDPDGGIAPEHPLKKFLIRGSVPFAELAKMRLKKYENLKQWVCDQDQAHLRRSVFKAEKETFTYGYIRIVSFS